MISPNSDNEGLSSQTADNEEKEIVNYLKDQRDTSNIISEFAISLMFE